MVLRSRLVGPGGDASPSRRGEPSADVKPNGSGPRRRRSASCNLLRVARRRGTGLRGQKNPRRPSLRRRGTTCTCRCGTLWLTPVVHRHEGAVGVRGPPRPRGPAAGRRRTAPPAARRRQVRQRLVMLARDQRARGREHGAVIEERERACPSRTRCAHRSRRARSRRTCSRRMPPAAPYRSTVQRPAGSSPARLTWLRMRIPSRWRALAAALAAGSLLSAGAGARLRARPLIRAQRIRDP